MEEEEKRRRGWQGTNVVTKPRGYVGSRSPSMSLTETGGEGQGVTPPCVRKCSQPFKATKIHKHEK